VSIIHGKGLNSAGGVATLRSRVREVLMRIPAVLAFAPAPASDGGSGAVYIPAPSMTLHYARPVAWWRGASMVRGTVRWYL
jgi:hypothetical protein